MADAYFSSPEVNSANATLKRYLLERDDIFRQLQELKMEASQELLI